VDVGAKAAIYGLLRDATQRGMAVLVNSSDTKELAELCDRVLVLDRGRQVAELQGVELSEEALLRASLDASTERVGA
jgi:ribose transport system ATP-binding protein